MTYCHEKQMPFMTYCHEQQMPFMTYCHGMQAQMHVDAPSSEDMQLCLLLSLAESDKAPNSASCNCSVDPQYPCVHACCWQGSLYTCCKHQMVQRGSPHCPLRTCLLAMQELA